MGKVFIVRNDHRPLDKPHPKNRQEFFFECIDNSPFEFQDYIFWNSKGMRS